jgi:excisionase family DNA binding protein
VIALAHGPTENGAEWISIREASALVGVSVATLRRWCNAGRVSVFTTPGGHRRFARSAVLGLIPVGDPSKPLADNGETQIRMVRSCRRAIRRGPALPRALETISDRDRGDLREHGRQMLSALVEALDAGAKDGAAVHHARARRAAAACGVIAGTTGLSLQDTLALVVRFRAPFLHEVGSVCRRRGLDASATSAILERASEAVDGLLPAVISGFESAAWPDRARSAAGVRGRSAPPRAHP